MAINETECKYNSFDGGNTQRGICSIDGKFCDCLRTDECYFKLLKKKEAQIEKIKSYIDGYKQSCKLEGVCIDDRLCSTCFYGGAVELGDEILDVINEVNQ